VMCPVFFADPTDLNLRMEDQAFLLGQDVMVIPKWAKDVRLPQGIWRSVSIAGENAATDIYQCDVKVRGGAIVPLGPLVQTTQEISPQSPLTLMVVLDDNGQAVGTLYEDTGQGYGYLRDEYCLSHFNAQNTGNSVYVKCTEQIGKQRSVERLVTVAVVSEEGVHYGFGDIINGVKVRLNIRTENLADR